MHNIKERNSYDKLSCYCMSYTYMEKAESNLIMGIISKVKFCLCS